MSLSRTVDRKGSKVLKVALSTALAAAFTPMAAAPALAAAPTAQETTAIVSGALGYSYTDYQYTGTRFVDGSTVVTGYTPEQVASQGGKAVMNDTARFLGALHRYTDSSPVNAIRYGNAKYVWDETTAGNLAGSNWVKDSSDTAEKATLVSAIVKDLAAGLGKNRAASATVYVSTDNGAAYSQVTLRAAVSTAQLLDKDGKVKDSAANYSLAGALAAATSGDTVRMTSDTVTNEQLTLPAGVTLDGNGRTLTHLSNPSGTAAGSSAAILHTGADGGAAATIKNLKVDGPNTAPATTATDGTVTRHWTDGEYAVKAWGEHANLVVENLEVTRAQSALMASKGAELTVKGSLRMSNLEYGGIEVSEDANSKLILDSTASITYAETADTPFAWIDNGGSIENKTKLTLAKVKASDTKAHYYLNASDSKGAHLYTATELALSTATSSQPAVVNLGGRSEYALLKFVPAKSGTYCLASSGVAADAAAELYSASASGGLGAKVASGDNEQGENFRVFAKLTGGSTYFLKVGISASAKGSQSAGDINVTASEADAASLDSYVVSLPANAYYYSDENLTAASSKLATTVRSAIDGKALSASDYEKAIHKVNDDGTIATDATNTISAAGRYALKVTPKTGSTALTGKALCYFDVKDAADVNDYDFRYNSTLVFASNQVASITALAPKAYRYGNSGTVCLSEGSLSVEGWYSIDKDGVEAKLASAPSAVGSYVLKVKPINTTVNGKTTSFNESTVKSLSFSITRGKVAVPSARTGLTYTGSAQVGVSTGANYTLSGTYSATNAGTYSCTATLAEGYSWADGTTAPKTITWSIAKARVSVPSGNPVSYTGKAQVGVSAGTGYTLSGTTSATEPGDYTCTATPTANYMWSDGTTASKTVRWTLAKAAAGITAAPASVVVNRGGRATVALRQAGTAGYTVVSSDSKVATASVSGSSVSIAAVASGTATITVSTAATARYAAGSATIAVSVPKSEGENGTVSQTTVNPDGTSTTVTSSFKVTTEASASDAGVVPTVAFTGTSAKSGKVVVPESVTLADGVTYKVTSVAARALKGKRVTGVTLPKSVTKVGAEALAKTSRLKSLTLGKTIKSVGKDALKGSALKSVTIKTSKLSKASVRNLVKGSKLTTVKCSGVSKKAKANYKKWAKAYKAGIKVK